MQYDVDVTILSWNRTTETLAAIDSALAQTGVRVAVQIVDQGSAPECLAALKAHIAGHPDIALRALPSNVGVPAGRNLANAMGSAPIIVSLDNDAEFSDSEVLARTAAKFRENPGLGAIGFRILNYWTGEDDVTSWGYPQLNWDKRDGEFDAVNTVGAGQAVLREAFEAARGYEDRLFFGWEELELSLKILNLGYGIRYAGGIGVRHKVSPEARVCWTGGRFYFEVRNRLYILLKSGTPIGRVAQSAGGYLLRGLGSNMLWDVLRGLKDALRFYLSNPADPALKALSRLRPEVHALVDELSFRSHYGFWARLANVWTVARCGEAKREAPARGALGHGLGQPKPRT